MACCTSYFSSLRLLLVETVQACAAEIQSVGMEISAQSLRWRPDEGPMLYNQRTSKIIQKCFLQYGVKPLHYRVLRAVFKHAWQEIAVSCPTGANFLVKSRELRNRMWWGVFKVRSDYRRRRQENLVHAFSGSFTQWDNLLL